MRIRRIALLAAGMLLTQAAPAGAQTSSPPFYGVSFTISPVGGTPGTAIFVDGQCFGSSEGNAYLDIPPTSDAIFIADAEHFSVNGNHFSATLNNPFGTQDGFPVDARVRVQCGFASASHPFQGSNTPTGNSPSIFTALGTKAHVKGFNASGALAGTNFYPEGDSSNGPSIAVGDVTGDGRVDVVTGSGKGATGVVRVSAPTGDLQAAQAVYPTEFTGGVNVAVGDVNGDGRNDVVTGAGPGGGPHVLVLSYNQSTHAFDTIGSFFAYTPSFAGGVSVAVLGHDIVTAPGAGGGPHVRRFNGNGAVLGEFMAYAPNFTGGVSVAAISDAFGGARIVTGPGAGGGPHVAVFTPSGAPVAGFYAYDPSFTGGVSVAAGRVNGTAQIVTGAGPGGGPHVRIFNIDGSLKSGGFYAYAPSTAGVKVAVSP
jgi:hypothetical protein